MQVNVMILLFFMQVNVNLAGLPALVVPCGFVEGGPAGLPVGLQMIGVAFHEVSHNQACTLNRNVKPMKCYVILKLTVLYLYHAILQYSFMPLTKMP